MKDAKTRQSVQTIASNSKSLAALNTLFVFETVAHASALANVCNSSYMARTSRGNQLPIFISSIEAIRKEEIWSKSSPLGESAPSEDAFSRPLRCSALHPHTRAQGGLLPSPGAFSWGWR